MGTYLSAASGGDPDRARELYLWDRDLSVAFLGDLAILEVALRDAMSAQLEAKWGGVDWYENTAMPLDDRSMNTLSTAWGGRVKEPKTPGRLVAQCMFGFWRGGSSTRATTPAKPPLPAAPSPRGGAGGEGGI